MAGEKIGDPKNKKSHFEKFERRKATILRNSRDLSILCGVKVCVVILPPDGKVEAWPENLEDVRAAFREAAACDDERGNRKRRRGNPCESQIPDGNWKRMKLAIAPNPESTNNNNISSGSVSAEGDPGGKNTADEYLDLSHAEWYGDITDIGFPAPSLFSSTSYGGGPDFENQILPHLNHYQQWSNGDFDFTQGTVYNEAVNMQYDPLWVQPLQGIENEKRKKLLISSPKGQTCDDTNHNVSEGDYFDFSPENWYGDITDIGSPDCQSIWKDVDTNNNINIVSEEDPGGKGHFLYPSQSHPDMYLCDSSSSYGMNEAEFENQCNQEWSNADFPFSEGMVNNGVLNMHHDPWVQQL